MIAIPITNTEIDKLREKQRIKKEQVIRKYTEETQKKETLSLLKYIKNDKDQKEYNTFTKEGHLCLTNRQLDKIDPSLSIPPTIFLALSVVFFFFMTIIWSLYFSAPDELDQEMMSFAPYIILFFILSVIAAIYANRHYYKKKAEYTLKLWKTKKENH